MWCNILLSRKWKDIKWDYEEVVESGLEQQAMVGVDIFKDHKTENIKKTC
jgi:hypothetical protein